MNGLFSEAKQAMLAPIEHEHFWFIARKQVILSFTPREGRMLDIGCGNGTVTNYLKSYGIDIEGVEGSDVNYLPFECEYDTIGLFDVLEHTNDIRALGEIYKALKPGGVLVATVPALSMLWGYQDRLGHRKRYNKLELTAIIRAMGFEIERVSYFCMLILPLTFLVKKLSTFELKRVPVVNGLLLAIMELECQLLKYRNLPFGSSLIVRARKKG